MWVLAGSRPGEIWSLCFISPHLAERIALVLLQVSTMQIPSGCSNCRAPFPESLERFGANVICKRCGQIQRIEGQCVEIEDSLPDRTLVDLEEVAEESHSELPPIDELLTRGWAIFRARMGLCISTFLIASLMNYAVQTPLRVWQDQLIAGDVPADQMALISLGALLAAIGQTVFSTWLNIGYSQILLRLVRGEPTEFNDLFRGGRFLTRGVLCTFLLTLAIVAGLLLCVVPGVLISLMYWPFMYVLIDRDLPGVRSLWMASAITDGWKWQLLALFVICTLITLFGVMALIVGVIVAAPYTFVVYALAYDRISRVPRQPPRDETSNVQ